MFLYNQYSFVYKFMLQLSSAHNLSNASGGMIAELLQNPQLLQQQHKEYFAAAVAASGQLPERIQGQVVRAATPVASGIPPEIAARFGNPASSRTPTPPVSADLHSPHGSSLHLRHPAQSGLIVPSHSALPLIPTHELNAFVHHQFLAANAAAPYPYRNPIHAEMPVQDAQVRAAIMGMNPRFAYSMPLNPNAYGQPSDRLQMDPKSDKSINDLSKIVQESRGADEKAHHSVKSGRSKKEDKDKMMHPDRDDHESRHMSAHEKITSTSAIPNHSLLTAHYPSMHKLGLSVSPNERITDSPIVANPYATGPGRVPPIPISGQIDDHKTENLSLSSHHYKGDPQDMKQPPAAHQTVPLTPYHSLSGLPTPGHIDGRSSNPAHSPSSHIYKKDSSHSQQISLHNPATDKRVNSEHSKKVVHPRTHSLQGSSISPGPAGMPPAHSPVPWSMHSSLAQSPHVMLTTNEQSSRRVNPHIISQIGSEVPVHVPPPAHVMSQPSNVPRTLPQTPPHASQVPSQDAYILRVWILF